MLYLQVRLNDPLAFYHIRSGWTGWTTQLQWVSHPLDTSYIFISQFFGYGKLIVHNKLSADVERIAILLSIGIAINLWINKYKEELIFYGLTLLPAILQVFISGYKRYLFVLFPLYMVIAKVTQKNFILQIITIEVFLIIYTIMLLFWLFDAWVAA